jgi:hypothetical protein
MRDSGYDYNAFDLYDGSKYANYFRIETFQELRPALVSAFEVFEHFPEPGESLRDLLCVADLVVFTTQFYEGQGDDWDYLVPCCGQHVFFYSEEGLAAYADAHGFNLRRTQDFSVLVRRTSQYSAAVEAAGAQMMDSAFIAEHILRVGWGTEATARDHAYALDRFTRELRAMLPGRSRRWASLLSMWRPRSPYR